MQIYFTNRSAWKCSLVESFLAIGWLAFCVTNVRVFTYIIYTNTSIYLYTHLDHVSPVSSGRLRVRKYQRKIEEKPM